MDLVPITTTAFNQFEVVLWSVASAISFGAAHRSSHTGDQSQRTVDRILWQIAGVTFLLFAGTDAVEIRTGAWWRPWWLLVWNALCILTLLGLAAVAWYSRRSAADDSR